MNTAPVTATETFGPYEVYERLGMGGMASVHRAKKRGPAGFERTVALKRMLSHLTEDRGFIDSFVREAKVASLLVHPNIAQIYDFGRIGGVFYIAMELVAGFDIRKLLRYAHRTGQAIPLGVILTILAELCDALDYAHSFVDEDGVALNIVHRDISPSNIIVAHTGHVKVIDFGIAKASSTPLHTESGLVKGKLGYMAPEAAMGLQVNAASDIFSVGVTAWELVTALPLFSARTDYETMRKLREEAVPPASQHNPACPPRLEQLINNSLQRDPEYRIASARVFRNELEAIAQEAGVQLSARAVAEWTKHLSDTDSTARAATVADQRMRSPSGRVLPLPPEPETAMSKPRAVSLSKAPPLRRSSDEIQLATEIWGDPTVHSGAGNKGGDFSAAEAELYQPDGIVLPVIAPAPPPPPVTTTTVRKSRLPFIMLAGLAVIAGVLGAVLYAKRPPAPVAPKASVVFHTEPTNAIVEIAGKPVGSAAELEPGVYSVSVHSDGYKPWTTSMTLAAGDHQTINVALEHEAVAIVEAPKPPPKRESPRREVDPPPVHEKKHGKSHREEVAKVEPPKQEVKVEPEPPKPEVKVEPPKVELPKQEPAVVETKPKTTPVVAATAVTKISGDIPALSGGGASSGDVLAKMCIDESGRVSSVQIKKSPADIASDLQHALTSWRYKPYMKGDKASPVCFALQLRVVLKP